METVYIMLVIGLALVVSWLVADRYAERPPQPSPCTGDCNQGRNCHCVDQEKLRLDDEFNNANWPFPVNKP